jgi:hypothetical protein
LNPGHPGWLLDFLAGSKFHWLAMGFLPGSWLAPGPPGRCLHLASFVCHPHE